MGLATLPTQLLKVIGAAAVLSTLGYGLEITWRDTPNELIIFCLFLTIIVLPFQRCISNA